MTRSGRVGLSMMICAVFWDGRAPEFAHWYYIVLLCAGFFMFILNPRDGA
jgi:hypothetical protein